MSSDKIKKVLYVDEDYYNDMKFKPDLNFYTTNTDNIVYTDGTYTYTVYIRNDSNLTSGLNINNIIFCKLIGENKYKLIVKT